MALTPSTMLELGTPLPTFSLLEPRTSKQISSEDFESAPALVIMVICNHCPYVQRIRPGLQKLGYDYHDSSVAIVAVSANDPQGYPEDAPDKIAQEAETFDYRFPYLFDADQTMVKSLRAACTPEFYLFDGERRLAYRGQFDSARPGNRDAVTGDDLRAALEAVLNGKRPAADQKPSIGCNIKWRPGNEPNYVG